MTYTLVAFHAHPDDEALLTSGTMARAAADGHRVVLVVATSGEFGEASSDYTADGDLGEKRRREARRSARALGVARVEFLGYHDSGSGEEVYAAPPGEARFVDAPLDEAAERLAAILREENADVLLSYDVNGGYGHQDHKRVHEVGARAAQLAGTTSVLEATVDRSLILKGINLAAKVYTFPPEFDAAGFQTAFLPRAELTHSVNVRRFIVQKRVSFRAHASQASSDGGDRTLAMFLLMPRFLFGLVLGHEWFREVGRASGAPGEKLLDDIFATVRERGGPVR